MLRICVDLAGRVHLHLLSEWNMGNHKRSARVTMGCHHWSTNLATLLRGKLRDIRVLPEHLGTIGAHGVWNMLAIHELGTRLHWGWVSEICGLQVR